MIFVNINKKLGSFELDVKLNIKEGEFIAITGASGSGKTSLLRVIAGLDGAFGEIVVSGKEWLMNKCSLPTQKRNIGYLTQEYALFSNMSVVANLLYVKHDLEFANYLLNAVGLSEFKNHKPQHLSGGQRQRVALARALISKPKLLLLDEPLSALGYQTRVNLQNEILKLHKEFNLTTIMVSHDRAEVVKMADRIIEIDNGKIINSFKKESLELTNTLNGRVVEISKEYALVEVTGEIVKIKIDKKVELNTEIEITLNIK